jgi:hypothetical protein
MVILIKIINQKNHVFFMPHAFIKVNILLVNVDTLVKLNLLKSCDLY